MNLRAFLAFFILSLSFLNLKGQTIYIAPESGGIYEVDLNNCTKTKVFSFSTIWSDIAMCSQSSTTMYGLTDFGDLYEIDIPGKTYKLLTNSTGYSQLTPVPSAFNSLVCDGNGNLYAVESGGTGLYKYDIANNLWSYVGNVGYSSAGDLTFYNGQLYLTTNMTGGNGSLISITLNPFSSHLVANINKPNIFGTNTITYINFCNDTVKGMIAAGNGLYSIDPATGVCTPKCQFLFNEQLFGATSPTELSTVQPTYLTVSADDTICSGKQKALHAMGANTYKWMPGNLNGANVNVKPTATTIYTLTATDASGCTKTASVKITVVENPTATPIPVDASCNQNNGSASVNVVGGTSPYTYSWYLGATTSTVSNLSPQTYSVIVTDINGCTSSSFFDILGSSNLGLTVPSASVCNNQSATLTATANGTAPYTYSWSTGATTSSISVSPNTTTTYTVTASDAGGCSKSSTVVVSIGNSPQLTVTPNASSCSSQTGSATVSVSGGNSPYVYSWSNGATSSSISNVGSGNYTLTITDNSGCSSSSAFNIQNAGNLNLSISPPDTICSSQSTTLTATANGTAPYTYSWSTGATTSTVNLSPTNTTTYTVTVTDAGGCSNSGTTQINISNTPLSFTLSPNKNSCIGDQVQLSATQISGVSPFTYSWSGIASNTAIITVSPQNTSTYTVTITDACLSTASNTVQVIINPLPIAAFSAVASAACDTACVIFHDASSSNPANILTWNWTFDTNGSSTLTNPTSCFSNSGSYPIKLTVTDENGCTASTTDTLDISVNPKPKAQFSFSPAVISASDLTPVSFINNSTNGTTYNWNFGDTLDAVNNTSSSFHAQHTYTQEGMYCIQLIAESSTNCNDTTTNCLEVLPDWALYVPDAFSPNGDNKNDVFYVVATNITDFEMFIFDRWGNEIFRSTNVFEGWNGKVLNGASNQIVQQDVYVWLINFSDVFGRAKSRTGHVSLIK